MTNTSTSTATLIEMDPNTVTLETNIRTEAALDAGFLAAIRANGVVTPVLGHRDADGSVHVRAGQRRILAAREVGLATVPVYLVDATDDVDADRIIQQLVENEHRDSMTDTDKVAAYKALELEGLSVTAIAKRTGTKRDVVKTSLTVAGNDTAAAALKDHAVTLDQAAVLVEFADDAEVVEDLTHTATSDPDYFPHAVEQARQNRASRALQEQIEQAEAEKGHRILTEWPAYGSAPWGLGSLRTADGERVDADSIQGKEGVAVYVQVWGYDNSRVDHYVDNPEAIGLTLAPHAQTQTAQKGPMTDEQKAERKTLIANNKAWDAAEVVRREWVSSFLGRKTLPKNAPLVTATLLTAGRRPVAEAMSHGNTLAASLLGAGTEGDYWSDRFADYLTAHPTRAARVSLAVVLGGIEASTDRNTWRNPDDTTAHYLRTLQGWGYALSPVECIAAMIPDQDDAEDEAQGAPDAA